MKQTMANQQRFRGPVPGQGMTAELKSRPWFNPPQYNTVEEALEFYLDRLVNQQQSSSLFAVIEKGLPLTTLSETITTGGVMQGVHTVDIAFLINPLLVEFMKGMCEVANIKYTLDGSVPKEDQVNMRALKEVIKSKVEQSEDVLETAAEEVKSKGLMARKNKETE
tara:strand:+ start:9921 stop:10418 length:498 start_codon:yes stop_codon:yes gene_type:complete